MDRSFNEIDNQNFNQNDVADPSQSQSQSQSQYPTMVSDQSQYPTMVSDQSQFDELQRQANQTLLQAQQQVQQLNNTGGVDTATIITVQVPIAVPIQVPVAVQIPVAVPVGVPVQVPVYVPVDAQQLQQLQQLQQNSQLKYNDNDNDSTLAQYGSYNQQQERALINNQNLQLQPTNFDDIFSTQQSPLNIDTNQIKAEAQNTYDNVNAAVETAKNQVDLSIDTEKLKEVASNALSSVVNSVKSMVSSSTEKTEEITPTVHKPESAVFAQAKQPLMAQPIEEEDKKIVDTSASANATDNTAAVSSSTTTNNNNSFATQVRDTLSNAVDTVKSTFGYNNHNNDNNNNNTIDDTSESTKTVKKPESTVFEIAKQPIMPQAIEEEDKKYVDRTTLLSDDTTTSTSTTTGDMLGLNQDSTTTTVKEPEYTVFESAKQPLMPQQEEEEKDLKLSNDTTTNTLEFDSDTFKNDKSRPSETVLLLNDQPFDNANDATYGSTDTATRDDTLGRSDRKLNDNKKSYKDVAGGSSIARVRDTESFGNNNQLIAGDTKASKDIDDITLETNSRDSNSLSQPTLNNNDGQLSSTLAVLSSKNDVAPQINDASA